MSGKGVAIILGVVVIIAVIAGIVWYSQKCCDKDSSIVVSEVKVVDGVPRIFLNGKEEKNLMMAEVYHYRDDLNPYELPYVKEWVSSIKKIIDNASGLGTKVLILPIWWNEVDKATSSPDSVTANLDFSPIDQVMDYAKSKNMYVLLSPEMHKMIPIWWAEENDFPIYDLERDSSICIPKEKDAEVSCVPKELCDTGQPCCKSETSNLYCCVPITEELPGTDGRLISKRLNNEMVKCVKANNDLYKKCDFCEMDAFGWKHPYPSKGSDKMQDDYGEYLTFVVDRYKNHPALFGWQFAVGATGEDFYGDYTAMKVFGSTPPQQLTDYSPFFAREFFKFLRNKYNNNQEIQDAWGDSAADLSNEVIPPPSAFFKNGTKVVIFPGDFLSPPGTEKNLTQKGKDFYEFRELMIDTDRQHFVPLFKERDPHHILIYATPVNDNTLANEWIDGSCTNPNLLGDKTGDKYDVTQYYQEINQAIKNGRVMYYATENGAGRSTENENQLKAIERFGKAVKCFGGYFGYVTEIPQKTNGMRYTMPSWVSEGAQKAIRNIFSYSPTADCSVDFISNTRGTPQNLCDDGICDGLETSANCPTDCEVQPNTNRTTPCGDGICDDFESQNNACPEDCGLRI